ncbi:putative cytoplasmic protein [Klebsiella pneumoniae]|nr:putative cytoplasmic protein [Klebsiella pneumoniae]
MRIFKTKWFAREASSHGISDDELYQAIQSALQGKVVDLGGGVYKKRLNKNRDRAIILTKSAGYWFYTFLYAKTGYGQYQPSRVNGFS